MDEGMTSVFAQQVWNGIAMGMAYTLFSVSLFLIFGVLGVITMAHGAVYMLGALGLWAATSLLHLNFFLAMLLVVAVVGLFGLVINRVAVQPLISDPLTVLLSTLGVSIVLVYGISIFSGSDARFISTPFKGTTSVLGAVLTHESLVLFSIGLAALIGLYFLLKTKIGKAIRATAQDRIGASLVGVNSAWIYAFTMAVASAMAALAGVIIGVVTIVYPSMGQGILLKGFAVVVVIGKGNLRGYIFVGLLLGVTEALFGQYVSMYFADAYVFGILVLACLVRPKGLFSRA